MTRRTQRPLKKCVYKSPEEELAMKTLKQTIFFLLTIIAALTILACGGGGGGGGEATLVSIEVIPEFATIVKGSTKQFTANGHYSDNTTRDITASVSWSPEHPVVATINSSGLATGVSVGQTFIIATLGGVNGYLALLTVTADLRPSAPTNVSAAAGNGQVAVSWSAVTGATSYNIYWATTSGVTKSTGTKISNVTSPYLHSSLSNETTYYYVVTAVNSYGESSESLQANATPSATLAAGSLDITFGSGGKVTTGVGTVAIKDDAAYAMAIQGDGKIVAAGQAFVRPSIDGYVWSPDIALVRYNSDGSLDNTFGSGGITTTAVGSIDDYAESVAIQGDGKILVSGDSWNSGNDYDFALVRYNPDGSLDSTFGTGGKMTTDIRSSADGGYAVAIQGDGKIIIAGDASRGNTAIWDIALARFNTDGSLDSTFGTSGKVTTVVGSGSAASDVSIQNDGKIVIAGGATVDSMRLFTLVRYNTDGSLDSTFGSGGVVTTAVGSSDDGATAVSILSDGKIMASGRSWNGSNYDFALVRYNTDGSLDSTFGTGGKVMTAVGSGDDKASDMAIQTDGRIVLTGRSWNGSNDDFALVRYLP
jgi:uncharacterized delta-60 repeat protein